MKVVVLPAALDDLAAGHDFYETQQSGLGAYFLETLEAQIDGLAVLGGIHRRVMGAHRLLTPTFPFAVYYQVSGDQVQVTAVLDCRRDPHLIRRRLRS